MRVIRSLKSPGDLVAAAVAGVVLGVLDIAAYRGIANWGLTAPLTVFALFLLPPNIFAALMLWERRRGPEQRTEFAVEGPLDQDEEVVLVRFSASPRARAALAYVVGCFCAALLFLGLWVALSMFSFRLAVAIWATNLVIACLTYLAAVTVTRAGRDDLRVDSRRRTVVLPRDEAAAPTPLRFDSIVHVECRGRRFDPAEEDRYPPFTIVLSVADPTDKERIDEYSFGEWDERDDALPLVRWLQVRIEQPESSAPSSLRTREHYAGDADAAATWPAWFDRADAWLGAAVAGVLLAPVVAGLIWIDARLATSLKELWQTQRYATAPGTVLRSGIERAGKGLRATTTANIQFRYHVGGQRYVSDRVRPSAFAVTTEKDAARLARDYRVGVPIMVWHDPATPERAVLRREWAPLDTVLALFAVPASLIATGFVIGLARNIQSLAGWGSELRVRDKAGGLRVSWGPPALTTTRRILLAGSAITAAYMLSRHGFEPPLVEVFWCWGIAVGVAVFEGGQRFFAAILGKAELVVDREAGTLQFPSRRHEVDFDAITAVGVKIARHVDSDGENRSCRRYSVSVQMADAKVPEIRLGSWRRQGPADRLAALLREELGLPRRAAEFV